MRPPGRRARPAVANAQSFCFFTGISFNTRTADHEFHIIFHTRSYNSFTAEVLGRARARPPRSAASLFLGHDRPRWIPAASPFSHAAQFEGEPTVPMSRSRHTERHRPSTLVGDPEVASARRSVQPVDMRSMSSSQGSPVTPNVCDVVLAPK